MSVKPRTNLILDAIILVLCIAVLVTGLMLWIGYSSGGARAGHGHGNNAAVSTSADRTNTTILGLDRAAARDIHNWAGVGFGLLILVHLVFHWKWITCQTGRLIQPSSSRGRARRANDCPEALANQATKKV